MSISSYKVHGENGKHSHTCHEVPQLCFRVLSPQLSSSLTDEDQWNFSRSRTVSSSTMSTRSSICVYLGVVFFAICTRLIGAQTDGGNITVEVAPYDCSATGTLICLGDAHVYGGDSDGNFAQRLSLVYGGDAHDNAFNRSGVAYYYKPVSMRDSSTGQSASFNTTFSFNQSPLWEQISNSNLPGDGMAFVISADNITIGSDGALLGFFNLDGTNSFKSVVVEFDNYFGPGYDFGSNHVSVDFTNNTPVATKNTSDVNVSLGYSKSSTVYVWVEYSAVNFDFEVRVSSSQSRPDTPFLKYTVNLLNKTEELMWVGFSASTSNHRSLYYLLDWTFESPSLNFSLAPVLNSPPAITPSPASRSKHDSKVGIAVGVSVAVLLVIAGITTSIWFFRRRGSGSDTSGICPRPWSWARVSRKEDLPLQFSRLSGGYQFTYNQLSVATGGFSQQSKLGFGGFGSVYRGVVPSSEGPVSVAVKRINPESKQGEKEFRAEVSIISQLRHRNLIQLLGWSDEKGDLLIVYELMPNRSLDRVLFGLKEGETGLSWAQRFNIITGTAAAVDYLHQGHKQLVIHRDIKASNIMLDDEWNPKLGDFGLARLVDHQKMPATTAVAGTCGYIAPETIASGRYTEKTDVFAFGAVALEIACGRKSIAVLLPPDEMVLVDWVWQRLSEDNLLSVVDSRLNGEYDANWMEVVLLTGLHCSHPDPDARPPMRHVVQVLAGDAPVPRIAASKPAPVFGKEAQQLSINDVRRSRSPTLSTPTSTGTFSSSSTSTVSAITGR